MTRTDLEKWKAALEARAAQLKRSLIERTRLAIERIADPFDARLLAAERESAAQIRARDSRLLRQVEAARERLRKETFGKCLACEDEIAPKRLEAVPWAAYCVACQERAEQRQEWAAAA
jgi:DnaK suppressor protein